MHRMFTYAALFAFLACSFGADQLPKSERGILKTATIVFKSHAGQYSINSGPDGGSITLDLREVAAVMIRVKSKSP